MIWTNRWNLASHWIYQKWTSHMNQTIWIIMRHTKNPIWSGVHLRKVNYLFWLFVDLHWFFSFFSFFNNTFKKKINILVWIIIPALSPPLPIDGKFRKSPLSHVNPIATTSPSFTSASTANILLSNRMNQFYPRPNLTSFHNTSQQHSISKHFHHMLNQHTNFLQNSSLAFDRTALSDSLNLTTGYNHSHQDVVTSATAQPHHLHQS